MSEKCFRRWYDNDQKIAEAFEYLKLFSPEIQKEVALEIIDFLQNN